MRALRVPCFVLLVLLALSLANSAAMANRCGRWLHMLDAAQQSASQSAWDEAADTLERLEADFGKCSLWLHITSSHSIVDSAERLLAQARLMCRLREDTHVHEALSELRVLLQQAVEGEGLSLGNIL